MPDLNALISLVSPGNLGGINLLDIIIVVIIFFYAYEGYALGFVLALLDLASFILSFILALKVYTWIAQLLVQTFSMPLGFANAAGFFLTAFLAEVLLNLLFRRLVLYIPDMPRGNPVTKFFKNIDHWAGIIPGTISAFIILSFLLTVIVSLPSSPLIKHAVTGSVLGSKMIANTSLFED